MRALCGPQSRARRPCRAGGGLAMVECAEPRFGPVRPPADAGPARREDRRHDRVLRHRSGGRGSAKAAARLIDRAAAGRRGLGVGAGGVDWALAHRAADRPPAARVQSGDFERLVGSVVKRANGRRRVFRVSSEEAAEAVAVSEGFEPSLRFPVNTLSKRAPSTTRPPHPTTDAPRGSARRRALY